MTIQLLQKKLGEAAGAAMEAAFHCQVKNLARRDTKGGKPFFDLELADGTGEFKLKVWSNHARFADCERMNPGDFIAVKGEFSRNDFGVDSKAWTCAELTREEIDAVLVGAPERVAFIADRMREIGALVLSMKCAALRCLCQTLLENYDGKFQRAAAARGNHHARRGGLVEHVVEMMRTADGICAAYPSLNRSLLLAGVLFHDIGKLWENQYEESGFVMPFTERAELFGHIAIGVQVARELWVNLRNTAQVIPENADAAARMFDTKIIDHLCHLILSHHGTKEWGSPVEPKTPEAQILHFVDNIGAKMEMFRGGYESNPEIGKGVVEWVRPLRTNLVKALEETE